MSRERVADVPRLPREFSQDSTLKSDGILDTPWSRARERRSSKQEKRNGKLHGGSQQPNSGRIWRFHRDNKLWNFLVESRTNEKPDADTYRISRKEFLQIEREAFQTPPGLLPGMQVDIQELQLMVIRLTAFQQMHERIIELEALAEILQNQKDEDVLPNV